MEPIITATSLGATGGLLYGMYDLYSNGLSVSSFMIVLTMIIPLFFYGSLFYSSIAKDHTIGMSIGMIGISAVISLILGLVLTLLLTDNMVVAGTLGGALLPFVLIISYFKIKLSQD